MTRKVFAKEDWKKALDNLKDDYKLFVPFKDGDFHNFKPIDEVKKVDFDYENTRLSPKGIIYPQAERMFEYSLDPDDPEAHILKGPVDDLTDTCLAMDFVKRIRSQERFESKAHLSEQIKKDCKTAKGILARETNRAPNVSEW